MSTNSLKFIKIYDELYHIKIITAIFDSLRIILFELQQTNQNR